MISLKLEYPTQNIVVSCLEKIVGGRPDLISHHAQLDLLVAHRLGWTNLQVYGHEAELQGTPLEHPVITDGVYREGLPQYSTSLRYLNKVIEGHFITVEYSPLELKWSALVSLWTGVYKESGETVSEAICKAFVLPLFEER